MRRALIGLVGFVTLIALFYAEENWRGKRAWEKCKSELAAKDVVLDWSAYIPPPVPDDQNIFKAPKMQEWFVGRGSTELSRRLSNPLAAAIGRGVNPITSVTAAREYLKWSDQFDVDFNLIREALKRPYARMEGSYEVPYEMPIPSFVTLRAVAQTLTQRCHCFLLLNESEKALRELTLLHDICRFLEAEPSGKPMTLVAAMINVAITGLYTDTIADALSRGSWNEVQLAEIEKQLSGKNLLPDVLHGFQQEPAAVCRGLEILSASKRASMITFFGSRQPTFWEQLKNPRYLFIKWMPRGWVYQNMVALATARQKIITAFDSQNKFVLPREAEARNRDLDDSENWTRPFTILVAIALPNYAKTIRSLAQKQTEVNQALLACALERYRIANNEYPENLKALVPPFIEEIPRDVINGGALKYRLEKDGRYILYSIGWNETDDGGVRGTGKHGWENGDWVWQLPAQ